MALKNRYVQLALPYIPRLLQLIDRNPYSPTYGCFDRSYWHYRTMDFPCGMSQEFVLPLALVYAKPYLDNNFYGLERVRQLAEAAIRFNYRCSHSDGTCDDYFPFERAMGALVFSLYAASEAYQILGMDDPKVVELFSRRVKHLESHNETGRLSNHQALAALAAYNVFLITGDDRFRLVSEDRTELTLQWQHKEEGWFQEYEGADPGYHTCTIDFLAKLQKKRGDESLVGPLRKAVEFAWYFLHPDGSYGGEYGSRNTYHFYPHGFELMAPYTEKAGQIADGFLQAIPENKRYFNDDDRMTSHYVYDFLQAYEDYCEMRPAPFHQERKEPHTVWFPAAKIVVSWNGKKEGGSGYYAIANLSKGGVIKVFDEVGPIASDTGVIAKLNTGEVVISHLVQQDSEISADPAAGEFSVRARFCKRKVKLPNPFQNILFRIFLLVVGRFHANLTRSILQKILITGKPYTNYYFKRIIKFNKTEVYIEDQLPAEMPVQRLSIGSDATSIYVANSNVYQESVLCRWQHIDWNKLPFREKVKVWGREYYRGSHHSLRD
jgi:hypothetical protein